MGLKLYNNFQEEKKTEEIVNGVKKQLDSNPSEIVVVYEKKESSHVLRAFLIMVLFILVLATLSVLITSFTTQTPISEVIDTLLIRIKEVLPNVS